MGLRVILLCIVSASLIGTMLMFAQRYALCLAVICTIPAQDDQSARQAGRRLARLLLDSGDQLD